VAAAELERRFVVKPWGRADVDASFGWRGGPGEKLGEIWYAGEQDSDPPLLVKYLFTSQRLSIQVHPDDAAARAAGAPRGKDEAWLVLAADPGATIGLGLRRDVEADSLRAAACDGSLEDEMDWRPVAPGDLIYSPAGTIHALGAGLKVLEIQQNVDLTYRLYDYGRDRELHLDAALAVARRASFVPVAALTEPGPGRRRLAGPAFTVETWSGVSGSLEAGPAWVAPLTGASRLDGQPLSVGSVWRADRGTALDVDPGSEVAIAWAAAT
jgi:mannose-6-phosphate isomerase